jgi:Domain of unknown function (DUF1707)/Cell wall-active antibiotics response 4TMS YvqF
MPVLEPERSGGRSGPLGDAASGGAAPGGRGPGGRVPAQMGLRASDAERQRVADALRDAAGEGRLSFEELDERLEGAYTAKTHGDLWALIADLPAAQAATSDPERMLLRTSLGDLKQRGHWVVPSHIVANTAMGSIKIDFTGATCRHREVVIDATTGAGSIVIIVPRGWSVRTDEVSSSMGSVVNKATDPPARDAPSLRVVGSAGIGSIKVRYPYRFWWRRER